MTNIDVEFSQAINVDNVIVEENQFHAGLVNERKDQECSMIPKTEEFQLLHFLTFSIISTKCQIYDLPCTVNKIHDNIPLIRRPFILCSLDNFADFNESFKPVSPIISDDCLCKEYVFQNTFDEIKCKIKSLHKSTSDFISEDFDCSDTAPRIDKNSFVICIELRCERTKEIIETVKMFVLGCMEFREIQSAFIDFLKFMYSYKIQLAVVNSSPVHENTIKLLKKLMEMKKQLLVFYDKRRRRLRKSDVISKTSIIDDGQILAVQKCAVNISFVPTIPKLEPRTEYILKLCNECVLIRCVTNDNMIFAVQRMGYRNFGEMKAAVSPHIIQNSARLLFLNASAVIMPEMDIHAVDEIIYYINVLPFEKVTKLENIGRGGFGLVFKCQVENDEKAYAMKRIEVRGSSLYDLRSDIKCEIIVKAKIGSHDRIIKYHGFFEEKYYFFIQMDCMKETLGSYICKNHPLEESTVTTFAKQILEGLKYLHDHKIIHRDLKGANVLLDENDFIKLADFGISKCSRINNNTTENEDKICKMPLGTYNWMAPEIILDLNNLRLPTYGFQSDIWSFGATMVEMITGRVPFAGLSGPAVVIKLFTNKKIEYEFPQHLKEELHQFINVCLSSEPNQRPDCATLLMNDIFKL